MFKWDSKCMTVKTKIQKYNWINGYKFSFRPSHRAREREREIEFIKNFYSILVASKREIRLYLLRGSF